MLDDPTLAATGASVSRPSAEDSLSLRRGESAGRFVIIDELGRGAMGTVYAAFDVKLERQIALKILHRSDRGMGDLLSEAQALARVNHPNVVTVYDVGEHEGRLYLAMELVRGRTLRQWREQTSPSWREIVEHYRLAARGLHAVHAADLVHGDFKPDNVMVADDGRVLVMDFGIARSLEGTVSGDDLTASLSGSRSIEVSRIRGTPAFMAPEQFRLEGVGPASDQFSFCVALHEALWGERPFDGETLAQLSTNVIENHRRPRKPGVPRWVAQIVDRGLAPTAEGRFPSMRALDEAFDARRQRQRLIWVGVAGLGALAAGGATLMGGEDPCLQEREALNTLWTPERREELAASFAASGHRRASQAWSDAARTIDEFVGDWVSASDGLCAAEGLSEPEPVRQAWRDCLTTQRVHLRAALDELAEATPSIVSHAAELTLTLPRPQTCTEPQAGVESSPEDHERILAARGHLAEARAAWAAGESKRAVDFVDAGLVALEGADAPRTEARLYEARGNYEAAHGDTEARTDDLEAALRLAAQAKDDRLIAELWLSRAEAALADGQLEGASVLVRAADLAVEEAGRPDDLEALYQRTTASLGWKTGRLDEGLAAADRAIEIGIRADVDPSTVADSHNVRAVLLVSANRYAEAEAAFTTAIDLITELYGPDHPRAIALRGNLGTVLLEQGKRAAATEVWTSMLATLDDAGERSHQWAKVTSALADVKRELGEPEQALELVQAALAAWRALDDGDRGELSALRVASKIYVDLGRPDEAVRTAQSAMELAARTRSPNDAYAVNTGLVLGTALLARGDAQAALDAYATVRGFREEHFGIDDPRTTNARIYEARATVELDPERALAMTDRIAAEQDAEPEAVSVGNRLSVALVRARALERLGREDEARAHAKAVLARYAARRDDAPADYRELAMWATAHDAMPLTTAG